MTCTKCKVSDGCLPADKLTKLRELDDLERQHLKPCADCPFAGEHCCPFHYQVLQMIRKEKSKLISNTNA